jgi:outer membrane protein assembly factor BamB
LKLFFLLIIHWLWTSLALAQQNHYSATNLWQTDIGINNQSSPAMAANGIVYVTSCAGHLLAINPDGQQRWAFKFAADSVATPAVGSDGLIYFGSRDRRIYAVTPEGRQQWEFQTGGWVDASVGLANDGAVLVGSWDKHFYALDRAGKLKWKFATGAPIVSSAAIDANGIIYFGSHDRKFYALNPDGSLRWAFPTGGAILSSPAIAADGTIYFSSTDGTLRALDAEGKQKWRLHTGSISQSSPVLGATGEIYIATHTDCFAVDSDGSILWQWPVWNKEPSEPYAQASWTALANGHVLAMPGSGLLVELTGKDWVWHYAFRAPSYSSPLVNTNGLIYAMSFAASLNAIQGTAPPANSAWPMFRGNPQRTGRVSGGK